MAEGTALISPQKRNTVIRTYMMSPTAKKQVIKKQICSFCPAVLSNSEFEDHLLQNKNCRLLYCRLTKVKTISSVLAVILDCWYCEAKFAQLPSHLQRSKPCLKKYEEKFQCIGAKKVATQVQNLRRPTHDSRGAEKRKQERIQAKSSQTFESSLSTLRHNTMFSNVKLCIHCRRNVMSSMAIEIDVNSEEFRTEDLDCPRKSILKRLGKFWKCNTCPKAKEESPEAFFKMVRTQGCLYIPSQLLESIDLEFATVGVTTDDLLDDQCQVLMPCSIRALNYYENSWTKMKDPLKVSMYDGEKVDLNFLGLAYQSQLSKYRGAKESAEMFTAKILDESNKIISKTAGLSLENRIHGSIAWVNNRLDTIKWAIIQHGQYFFKINGDLPVSGDTKASVLIQNGLFVSASFQQVDNSEEFSTEYFVHNHLSTSDCAESCNLQRLNDVWRDDKIKIENMHTYLSASSHKVKEFVQKIVKSPTHSLYSTKYIVDIFFREDGKMYIEGLIWPDSAKHINSNGSSASGNEDFLKIAIKNLSTSSDPAVLQSSFKFSETRAIKLSEIVRDKQILCFEEINLAEFPLPCLIGMVKIEVANDSNKQSATKLLDMIRFELCNRPLEDFSEGRVSTYQFLSSLQNENLRSLSVIGSNVHLQLNECSFMFLVEGELEKLIDEFESLFMAVYHYCLRVCSTNYIILPRPHLLDCITRAFNHEYISALQDTVEIVPICGFQEYLVSSDHDIGSQIEGHSVCSFTEVLGLMDPKKVETVQSHSTVFVYTLPGAKSLFKKANDASNDYYKEEGGDNKFELLNTNVKRYYKRLNGKNLLLSEVMINYDSCSSQEAARNYELYRDKLEQVPLSEESSIVDNEKMPELLLCTDESVLQIRKNPKILKCIVPTEEDTFEFRFSKVMLFSLLPEPSSIEDLEESLVSNLFNEVSDDHEETKVSRYERLFYERQRGK